MKPKKIVVFVTTHETLLAEKVMNENSVEVKPVIKPRNISSQCGMALLYDDFYDEKIKRLCYDKGLKLIGTYDYNI